MFYAHNQSLDRLVPQALEIYDCGKSNYEVDLVIDSPFKELIK